VKNIVVCCDGTANEFAADRTNVVKLFSALTHDPAEQVAYYHPGLGTMEPAGALTRPARWATRLLGKAVGYGLEADVRDAYAYIMEQYEPGDRVFLFGFSRGAYTVRAVASLLRLYGLMPKGNAALVPYAVRMLTGVDAGGRSAGRGAYFRLAADFKACFGAPRACRTYFLGVWDTVSSVGWIGNPLRLPHTAANPDIRHVRHAIAIDERRAFFRTNLFRDVTPDSGERAQDLRQVWFPGVHCDVGGGYPEDESELSQVALRWMAEEAIALGLRVDPVRLSALTATAALPVAGTGALHESLTWPWWPAEFLPKRHFDWASRTWGRRMNLFRGRTVPSGALVHERAKRMGGSYLAKLPDDVTFVPSAPSPCHPGCGAGA
jgi:uncharacterized protein (DUF2235 family)